jgi:hypothetical protein
MPWAVLYAAASPGRLLATETCNDELTGVLRFIPTDVGVINSACVVQVNCVKGLVTSSGRSIDDAIKQDFSSLSGSGQFFYGLHVAR